MVPEQAERRLEAIMFTDIVDYTAAMAESEDKGCRLRERHASLVRPLVERYHGDWIEEKGDETLSIFPSAVEAVNCALAIQASLQADPELRLRVGIHLGDVAFQGGGVVGPGVNFAARIRPLAEPGCICVSDEVQQEIQNQENVKTESLGLRDLKGVPRRVEVFAVTGTAAAPRPFGTVQPQRRPRRRLRAAYAVATFVLVVLGGWYLWPQPSPIRTIAVLPLENLSGDPEQEYFADGMTEALIGDLAKLPSLTVISRTSVMRYKQTNKSLFRIAKELKVDGIIEGTVLREGDRVRITAQLIDARTDSHVWGDRYDREFRDVLALHSDVARAVAEQIRIELTPEERIALTASRPVDPRAYDAYLRGLQLLGKTPNLVWAPQFIAHFERAVEIDPEFAEAYVALSRARLNLANGEFSLRFRSEVEKAREAAQRALELDDRLAAAHGRLAWIRLMDDWDFPGARRAFERALQLNPNDPVTLACYAHFLLWVEGRTDESLAVLERMLRVAPLDLSLRDNRLFHLYYSRQFERALEELERAHELDPDFASIDVVATYAMLGRLEEAHRAELALLEHCGAPFCERVRKASNRGWAEGGWEGARRAVLDVLTDTEGYSPFVIAVNYAMIKETEEAFGWLERAYRARDPLMVIMKAHPQFDPLRSDPRFDDLLRRVGFPES